MFYVKKLHVSSLVTLKYNKRLVHSSKMANSAMNKRHRSNLLRQFKGQSINMWKKITITSNHRKGKQQVTNFRLSDWKTLKNKKGKGKEWREAHRWGHELSALCHSTPCPLGRSETGAIKRP